MDRFELPFIKNEFNDDLTSSLSLSSNTVINSSVPLCSTTTTQSGPSLSTNLSCPLPPHVIIETVQYDPNMAIKQEDYFEEETVTPNSHQMNRGQFSVSRTVKTEFESQPIQQHNIADSLKVKVKDEHSDDEWHYSCDQCDVKYELDCEESEQMNDVDGVIQPNTNEVGEVNEQCDPNGDDRADGQLSTVAQVDGDGNRDNAAGRSPRIIRYKVPTTMFKCDFAGCCKEFKQKCALTIHTRVHTGERPFPCPWNGCDKSFAQKRDVFRHLRVHNKPLKCSWSGCDKSFAEKRQMHRHLARVHNKPLKCSWIGCDKTFAQDATLQVHIRTHTERERPFVCNLNNCRRTFARKDDLVRHYNQMHNRQ